MRRRGVVLAVVGSLVLLAAASAVALPLLRADDPLSVVRAWDEARNTGDVDGAMRQVDPNAEILGILIYRPGQRDVLRNILEAQAVADWTVDDTDCQADGEEVTCRYVFHDRVMEAWGLSLQGTHQFVVRDGLIVRARRVHDRNSQAAAYAVFEDFRAWVRANHPEMFDVIWVDRTSALYTTPDGARAVLDLLDEYQPPT